MKRIHCLFDMHDLWELFEFCQSQHLSVFANNGAIIGSEDELIANKNIISFYVCKTPECPPLKFSGQYTWIPYDTNGVYINRPLLSAHGTYNSGMICVDSNDPDKVSIYSTLNRYVKSLYHRSWDSKVYIAPKMYQKWLEHQVSFDFFLDAVWFDIGQNEFSFTALQQFLDEHGILIEENGRDIRTIGDPLSTTADKYVLYIANAKMHTWIASRRKFFFTDSEVVFLYKTKKRGHPIYRFIADNRHFSHPCNQNVATSTYRTLAQLGG